MSKLNIDVNEQALSELSGYLEKTLSPDPNVRRPGKVINVCLYSVLVFVNQFFFH